MFCRCENVWGEPENTRTCPVCLAHPGTLPVPNKRAIEWTVKLGVALGCEIASHALFHRKNYFYPDLPKGYQISQYDIPLCAGGRFVVPGPDGDRVIGIVRAPSGASRASTAGTALRAFAHPTILHQGTKQNGETYGRSRLGLDRRTASPTCAWSAPTR